MRQEVLCKLFATDVGKLARGTTPAAEAAAGPLSLCLTLLVNAAAMSASLRRSVAEHLLPAAMALSRAAHALLSGNTGFQQQHRTAMLVFVAVCSSRCVLHGPAILGCVMIAPWKRPWCLCRSTEGIEAAASWRQCQLFLLRQAVQPHPLCSQLIVDMWCCMLR